MRSKINLHHGDCMEAMASMEDNAYSLAIVDPPYGVNINSQSQGKGGGVAKKINYTKKNWDVSTPDALYFSELRRVSRNQIIWGGNYFVDYLNNSPCWVVWDKINGETDFADCELAWTSFKSAVRKFEWKWSGMLQQDMKNKQKRIHPTEKPIKLYEWLLQNYANPGDKILDTHGGSMSIAIACWNLKFDLDLWELDEDYYKAGVERLNQHKSQLQLF